ncbi:MAG: HAMP domain-containing protein, partial [Solirubrobacteraceae bacterium]
MSLKVRLGLAAGVAVAIAVIAVAISAYAGTRAQLNGQMDQSLQNLAAGILSHAGPGGGPPGTPPGASAQHKGDGGASNDLDDPDEGLGLADHRGPAFGGAAGTVALIRRNGSTYVPTGQTYKIPITAPFKAIAARGTGRDFTEMNVGGTEIRVLATGIMNRGALLVALPMTDVNHALRSQMLLLGVIAAAGIALAALLGILVARTALAPIARFTRQTESIAAHPDRLESERLDVHGGDELARLAQTFNRTLDALQRSVQSQRNLVADASHELRTPIATIRANLQL